MRQVAMGRRKVSSGSGHPPRPPRPPRPPTAKGGRAFDVWLDRGLHEIFDGVAQEPIPDDLMKLLDPDRKE